MRELGKNQMLKSGIVYFCLRSTLPEVFLQHQSLWFRDVGLNDPISYVEYFFSRQRGWVTN